MAVATITAMEACPGEILNVHPESFEGYIREDEIPLAHNDPLLMEQLSKKNENYYSDHTRKNTILRNDVFDYMEETGDFRYLDHELEQMLEGDARKYTEMLTRLSKYRRNELAQMNEQREKEEALMKDPVFIKEQAEKIEREGILRKQDFENFLIVKTNKDFE